MNHYRLAVFTLSIALLGGCSQLQWERSIYKGLRESTKRDAQRHGKDALPDPKLPEAAAYERERERLRRGNAPTPS